MSVSPARTPTEGPESSDKPNEGGVWPCIQFVLLLLSIHDSKGASPVLVEYSRSTTRIVRKYDGKRNTILILHWHELWFLTTRTCTVSPRTELKYAPVTVVLTLLNQAFAHKPLFLNRKITALSLSTKNLILLLLCAVLCWLIDTF